MRGRIVVVLAGGCLIALGCFAEGSSPAPSSTSSSASDTASTSAATTGTGTGSSTAGTAGATSTEGSSSGAQGSGSEGTPDPAEVCLMEADDDCAMCRCEAFFGDTCQLQPGCAACQDDPSCRAALACFALGLPSCCSALGDDQVAALHECSSCAFTTCSGGCGSRPSCNN